MIDKVEAGKKYRLIDAHAYVNDSRSRAYNKIIIEKGYFDVGLCVVIDEVNEDGYGKSSGEYIISQDEREFFELVEENDEVQEPKEVTPETEVTITITYGELLRAYCVMGGVNGPSTDKDLFFIAGNLLDDKDRSKYRKIHSIANTLPALINYNSIREEWESLFFKSKEQRKKEIAIEQKRKMIAELEQEIKQLES